MTTSLNSNRTRIMSAAVDNKPLIKSSPSLDQPSEVSGAESPIKNEKIVNSPDESHDHSEIKDSEVTEPIPQETIEKHPIVVPPTSPPTGNSKDTKQDDPPTGNSKDTEQDDNRTDQPERNDIPHDDSEDSGPLVDMETFGQLLEMDDDDEHSFSKSLTWDYFDQAVTTFKEMDTAVLGGDLLTLSRKGHFLKGSSAALGLNRVKASCEKMQHYGNRKKANGEGALSEIEAMEKCKSLLAQLKEQQKLSKAWLERFYAERNV